MTSVWFCEIHVKEWAQVKDLFIYAHWILWSHIRGEHSDLMSRALSTSWGAPLSGDCYEELTKVAKTMCERAKAYLHLRGGGVSSVRCPAELQLLIKAVTHTADLSTGSVVSLGTSRLPQYWWPGSKRKLWTPGSDSSSPLDQQEHRLLWRRPGSHHSFWIWNRCFLCQPANSVPPLRG